MLTTAFQQAQSNQPRDENAALRERGREVFVARCGKCHDADASKKLPDGSTLLARLARSKDPHTLLQTRLKTMPAEDARAVHSYVDGLLAGSAERHPK